MAFLASIQGVIPILLIILLGYEMQDRHFVSDDFTDNVSKIIMNIALPAAVFASMVKRCPDRYRTEGFPAGL